MGVNLEAIRRKLNQLENGRKSSNVQMWKPQEPGTYKIRVIPWPPGTTNDGEPFIERWFYYLGNNPGILAPRQFGDPDPVNDVISELFNSGVADDRIIAKKMLPKMRCYAAILVEGQVDKGVQIYSFGKLVHQRLLSFFLDEEVGDFTDPDEGFDLKVTLSKKQGSPWFDTQIDAARKSTPLNKWFGGDDEKVKEALEKVPDINEMYRRKSTEEIKEILDKWLNGDAQDVVEEANAKSEETRNAPAKDELDKLADEVKTDKAETEAATDEEGVDEQKAEKKPRKKAKAKEDIDDAFAQLMEEK